MKCTPVPVDDEGTILPAWGEKRDSMQQNMQSQQLLRLELSAALQDGERRFDQKLARLLQIIDEEHCIKAASARMGISYYTALGMLRQAEKSFGILVCSSIGGTGSHTVLSENGCLLLWAYQSFQSELAERSRTIMDRFLMDCGRILFAEDTE